MLFNSIEYSILFLPATVIIYLLLKRINISLAKIWVCLASLYFYSFFTYQFIPLLILSIIVNYILIKVIEKNKYKGYIITSILFNVLSLAYFKYCNFFITNLDFILGFKIEHIDIIAPLAISFITFQQISISVSVYRKQITNISSLDYFSYILFFPKIISGPITNYDLITTQINRTDSYIGKYIAPALFIFSVGVFKKIVIASYFGSIADQGYLNVIELSAVGAWATSLSYTLQLYFDFSGYTDMAIGSALLFGIILPINFNSPYRATDLQDFWRRWHITLSAWLRNYVYIPLGGNRKGSSRTYFNLFLTFLIGGFWHGAGWNFLVWGALHGLGLVIHRYWSTYGYKMPSILGWFLTFNYVNITWVFFRTDNIHDAILILKRMFSFSYIGTQPTIFTQMFSDSFAYSNKLPAVSILLFCAFIITFCLVPFNTNKFIEMAKDNKEGLVWNALVPLFSAFLLCVAIYASLGGGSAGSFIYFNF